ncbi:MAG: GatB/YqeY domain-containing protein [Candidatus Omnitrophica bacterium]|nr:GatB/YqeY domain-containing protein [Candidatus Omnitrophota bacterium]
MLEEKILNDFKEAMKAKDSVRVSTLSFLRAALSYAALEKKKKNLDDVEVAAVIQKLIKQRQDSIAQFTAGGRTDLAEKETKELAILKEYLPAQLSEEEINSIIETVIAELGASSLKDMGRVMKEVTTRTAGRADGKLISDLVRKKLTG